MPISREPHCASCDAADVVIIDIPKLEQLIVSRLRAVIQDHLVYPNHLTLALPRLLSSSVSPIPIISDIGESAVAAMGDAVNQGFNSLVEDISGTAQLQADAELSEVQETPRPSETVSNPRISQRRIHMPAGFPHSTYASSSSNATSDIPGPSQRYPAVQPLSAPPPLSTSASRLRIPPSTSHGHTSSAAPSSAGHNQSNFRFRGQFASQPGTPGSGIEPPIFGQTETRRVGALNSRG